MKAEIQRRIYKENPGLNQSYRSKFGSYFIQLSNNFAYSLFLTILTTSLIIFVIPIFKCEHLTIFSIKYETIITIIDQRISNVVTLTSITLTIIVFLFNSLVIKALPAYKILIKKSFFFPILSLALVNIGCLIILSLLRDHLSNEYLTRVVISTIYMIIALLLLILYSFSQILKIVDKKYIYDELEKELLNEARNNLILEKISNLSAKIFEENMDKIKIDKYSSYNNTLSAKKVILNKDKIVYVKDINYARMNEIINEINSNYTIQYEIIHIGMKIDPSFPILYIFSDSKDANLEKKCKKIIKTIKVTTDINKYNESNELENYFLDMLQEAIKLNDTKAIAKNQTSLQKIYDLKYQNQ